jgi:YHS domain-containing protein
MAVRAGPEAIRISYDGGTVWFCSPGCRERFEAHPQAFAK